MSNLRDNLDWFKDKGVWEAVSERAPGLLGAGPQSWDVTGCPGIPASYNRVHIAPTYGFMQRRDKRKRKEGREDYVCICLTQVSRQFAWQSFSPKGTEWPSHKDALSMGLSFSPCNWELEGVLAA